MLVLIIDADADSAAILQKKLNNIIVGNCTFLCFTKSAKVLSEINDSGLRPDTAFIDLDPEINHPDGIALAEMLMRKWAGIQIVFTSEYDDYYLEAYDVDHAFFLRKPIGSERLSMAWNRVMSRLDQWETKCFSFVFNRTVYRIPYSEILFFENNSRRITIHTTQPEKSYHFYDVMSNVLPLLDHHFIRCHNSYIINIAKTDTWSRTSVSICGHKIPVSRRYAADVKDAFFSMVRK